MEYKIVEKPAFTFAGVSKRVPLQFEGVNNDIHLGKWTKKNLTMHTVKSGFRYKKGMIAGPLENAKEMIQ